MPRSYGTVTFIVDRMNVGATDREVIGFIRAKMRAKDRSNYKLRPDRKRAYRAALARHHYNQQLYLRVQRGDFKGRISR